MQSTHLQTYDRISPKLLKSELADKSVLITGGGYGIGAATAYSFAEAGVREIILVGRNSAKLEAAAKELESYKPKTTVLYRTADISSATDVKAVFASLPNGTVPDILVNNAGYMAKPANFLEADLEDYWYAFQVNVLGTIQVTQAFLLHRKAHAQSDTPPAVVITLNTLAAYTVRVPTLSSYSASKAALARWSEALVEDIPASTARFISIHPGAVKTDMGIKSGLDGVFPGTDAALSGDFIVWSASEEAKFLNGRFAWVNWDVDELVAAEERIISKDLFRTALSE